MHTTTRIIDLGEATALITIGFSLIRMEQSNSGKRHKIFMFDPVHPESAEATIEATIENYNRKDLAVDAISFYRAGKDLKNKIHEHDEIIG